MSAITLKQMCETIANTRLLTKKDGSHPTAEEIFNYSPTGELFMIWEWYAMAKALEAELDKIIIESLRK